MVERELALNQFEAARHGAKAIIAFAAAGGKFTEQQDKDGNIAAIWAAWNGAEAIKAFAAAGGKFTDQQDINDARAARRPSADATCIAVR